MYRQNVKDNLLTYNPRCEHNYLEPALNAMVILNYPRRYRTEWQTMERDQEDRTSSGQVADRQINRVTDLFNDAWVDGTRRQLSVLNEIDDGFVQSGISNIQAWPLWWKFTKASAP